jgi:hypothetical protein
MSRSAVVAAFGLLDSNQTNSIIDHLRELIHTKKMSERSYFIQDTTSVVAPYVCMYISIKTSEQALSTDRKSKDYSRVGWGAKCAKDTVGRCGPRAVVCG